MEYNLCALIPTYNHHLALPEIVEKLKAIGLPVFIIDDGSGPLTQETLNTIQGVHILKHQVNLGKGAALELGFRMAAELGYSHAFQIDADGQHSLDTIDEFIELSKDFPQALLSGQPIYDQSMPLSRKIGRWFTHVWVWIETLSFKIADSMCGFRIYPIAQVLNIIDKTSIGKRMDFDVEIIVRMFWEGTPVIMHPVKVIYPEANFSNFNIVKDNWRITKMHTRLVFTMLLSLPEILSNRPNYKKMDVNQ